MNNLLLKALCKKYEGEIAVAKAIINVYIENPVGIGEHPNIAAAMDFEIEKLAAATDKLHAIVDNFNDTTEYNKRKTWQEDH